MPMLRINATSSGLVLNDGLQNVTQRLSATAGATGPAIIMIHGFKYAPGSKKHCPHNKIMATRPGNWPSLLGFGRSSPDEGLGVAFGWYARGSLSTVHARAQHLGQHLAGLVLKLSRTNPTRPIHVVAHSLGAEIALSALNHLPAHAINRMVLLTGASYADAARERLDTPAGRSVDVLNVTSRENDLFDLAFERLVQPRLAKDRAIGLGIAARNVLTLQLDCPKTLEALGTLGFDIAGASRRVCHWSSYRRPGAMAFYSAFLRTPVAFSVHRLKRALPAQTAPRWSRLLAMPQRPLASRGMALPLRAQQVGSSPRGLAAAIAGASKNEPAY
ncbi:MAG: hypothetical protein AAF999_17275 [Pseudomonadota bacterium]